VTPRDYLVNYITSHESFDALEAESIVDDALEVGYPLERIGELVIQGDIDTLILNSWMRRIFQISGGPV